MNDTRSAPWRLRMLVLDELPTRHEVAYRAWTERGARLHIETSFPHGLDLTREGAAAPKFGLLLVPAAAGGRLGRPGLSAWEVMKEWVERYAANYSGRVVFYGPPLALQLIQPKTKADRARWNTLRLSPYPGPRDIERTLDDLDSIIASLAEARRAHRGEQ